MFSPSRMVVSVGVGPRCAGGFQRLAERLYELGEPLMAWQNAWPPGSPTHEENPYAFKIYALEHANLAGFLARPLLWLDSTVIVLKPLGPLWDLIERQGYWISRNHGMVTGPFCCDAALPILGISREEAFEIPHVVATCFGLDMRRSIAQEFLARWKALAEAGAFKGPHRNDSGEASADPRVLGHRHDQTAASVVAWRLGMQLTDPPDWFADEGYPGSETTLLTNRRAS